MLDSAAPTARALFMVLGPESGSIRMPHLASLALDGPTLEAALQHLLPGSPSTQPSTLLSWHVLPKAKRGAFLPAAPGRRRSSLASSAATDLWTYPWHLIIQGELAGAVQSVEVEGAEVRIDRTGDVRWDARVPGGSLVQTMPLDRQRLVIWFSHLVTQATTPEGIARRFRLLARVEPTYASVVFRGSGSKLRDALAPEDLAPLLESDHPGVRLSTLRALGEVRSPGAARYAGGAKPTVRPTARGARR
jgi:hypothetical protein